MPAARSRGRCVVVGYDGSDAARAALLWALQETDSSSRVVAVAVLGQEPAPIPGASLIPGSPDATAHFVERIERRWAQDGEDLEGVAELRFLTGHPAQTLAETAQSEAAAMIVIGHPHERRLEPLRASVARDLLSLAPCPVVIVP